MKHFLNLTSKEERIIRLALISYLRKLNQDEEILKDSDDDLYSKYLKSTQEDIKTTKNLIEAL